MPPSGRRGGAWGRELAPTLTMAGCSFHLSCVPTGSILGPKPPAYWAWLAPSESYVMWASCKDHLHSCPTPTPSSGLEAVFQAAPLRVWKLKGADLLGSGGRCLGEDSGPATPPRSSLRIATSLSPSHFLFHRGAQVPGPCMATSLLLGDPLAEELPTKNG